MKTSLDAKEEQLRKVDERYIQSRFFDLRNWAALRVSFRQMCLGLNLEDAVAGAFQLALEREDISADKVRLRQPVEDETGMIGPAGRRYEVDILADNGALLVFEVKSVCEQEDVDRFGDKVALMRTLHPDKTVDGVIVTLAPQEDVEARCAEWGIKLVH